jgi:putative two-component system response regulator
MVDAFLEIQQQFVDIAKRYADSDHDMEKSRIKHEIFTG